MPNLAEASTIVVIQQPVPRCPRCTLFPAAAIDDGPRPFTVLSENIVAWTTADGTPAALRDGCCHRGARLSKGRMVDARIVRADQRWTHACTGTGVRVPRFSVDVTRFTPVEQSPANATVPARHGQEPHGCVWVALADPINAIRGFPEDGQPGDPHILQRHQNGAPALCAGWRTRSATPTIRSSTRAGSTPSP